MSFNKLTVTPPKELRFGDLSTNTALILAPQLKKPPLEIALLDDQAACGFTDVESAECADRLSTLPYPSCFEETSLHRCFARMNLMDEVIKGRKTCPM